MFFEIGCEPFKNGREVNAPIGGVHSVLYWIRHENFLLISQLRFELIRAVGLGAERRTSFRGADKREVNRGLGILLAENFVLDVLERNFFSNSVTTSLRHAAPGNQPILRIDFIG